MRTKILVLSAMLSILAICVIRWDRSIDSKTTDFRDALRNIPAMESLTNINPAGVSREPKIPDAPRQCPPGMKEIGRTSQGLVCEVIYAPSILASGDPEMAAADALINKLNTDRKELQEKFPDLLIGEDFAPASAGEIRRKLLYMGQMDQLMLRVFAHQPGHWGLTPLQEKYLYSHLELELKNSQKLFAKELGKMVRHRGGEWFSLAEVGREAAEGAWLVAQHADHDPEFQQEMLSAMLRLPYGAIDKRELAFLTDRTAINHGRLQTYGTQLRCKDGEPTLNFNADVLVINARRSELGLESVEKACRDFESAGR